MFIQVSIQMCTSLWLSYWDFPDYCHGISQDKQHFWTTFLLPQSSPPQKWANSIFIVVSPSLRDGCANFVRGWDFLALSAGKPSCHKILVLGAVLLVFFWGGGGSANSIAFGSWCLGGVTTRLKLNHHLPTDRTWFSSSCAPTSKLVDELFSVFCREILQKI